MKHLKMLQAMMSEELQKRSKSQLLVSRDSKLCLNLRERPHNPTLALLSPESAAKLWKCELQLLPVLLDGFGEGGKVGDRLRAESPSLSSLFKLCLLCGET